MVDVVVRAQSPDVEVEFQGGEYTVTASRESVLGFARRLQEIVEQGSPYAELSLDYEHEV